MGIFAVTVKYYGIYLAYQPDVDMRPHGIGRFIASFLKGAAGKEDIRLVIVCPSWSRKSLLDLFEAESIPQEHFEVVCPSLLPVSLSIYQGLKALKSLLYGKPNSGKHVSYFKRQVVKHLHRLEAALVQVKSPLPFSALAAYGVILGVFFVPLLGVFAAVRGLSWVAALGSRRLLQLPSVADFHHRLTKVWRQPKDDVLVNRWYRLMEEREVSDMVHIANGMSHVSAWYCPTAFWPSFNDIQAPRLLCVPDVVPLDFPVGFAAVGGERGLQAFDLICETIQRADRIVTYSHHVKWHTLVKQLQVPHETISVIPHAPNEMNALIDVTGFPDNRIASINYCRYLFRAALNRTVFPEGVGYYNSEISFIFYASQFRPHKNVLTLIKVYDYLLRHRFIQQKLVLTGDPWGVPEIGEYIIKSRLQYDVLCLRGLSVEQLAACYRLADLAICPSLAEGGFPFTFGEALSVGTPVVLSRIPVVMEVLDDPKVYDTTLFDPYDWMDMARRIEWGLKNRNELLKVQQPFFERWRERTWNDVVGEYSRELDRLAAKSS